jgi:uncharacterized membrane protein YeiH
LYHHPDPWRDVPADTALVTVIEAAAVLACALSGMIAAADKRMDIVGTYVLAALTAFGGGTLRDLLLERRPFFWVSYWQYLLVILALAVVVVYSRRAFGLARALSRRAALVDALGLALFSLTGVIFSLEATLPAFIAPIIGVVTGTFGGVLRDIVVNEIPEIFRPGPLYAIPSFLGGWIYIALDAAGAPPWAAAGAAFLAIVGLRMASVHQRFAIPHPHWIRRPPE